MGRCCFKPRGLTNNDLTPQLRCSNHLIQAFYGLARPFNHKAAYLVIPPIPKRMKHSKFCYLAYAENGIINTIGIFQMVSNLQARLQFSPRYFGYINVCVLYL